MAIPRRSSAWVILAIVLLVPSLLEAQTGPDQKADLAKSVSAIEAEIRTAIKQIQDLSPEQPERALERLKKLRKRLEADTVLDVDRRQSLERMVQDRIRITEAEVDRPAANISVRHSRRAEAEERDAEQGVIKRLMEGIKRLQKEGNWADAGRQTEELARRQPKNVVAQANQQINSIADQLAQSRQLQLDRGRSLTSVVRGVEKSAVPASDDVEFPADWKAKTRLRSKSTAVGMTGREKAIMRGLDSPISVDFQGSPLDTVIDYLGTLTGQPIMADREALESAGISYESKVTFRVKGATLRTVLHKILGDLGLTYVVKDEVIQIITPLQARSLMTVQTYYIGDLITAVDEWGAAWHARQIANLIQSVFDPSSWSANGGSGTISYYPPTRSLVIRQSAEFHGTLAGSLP
jgi:hypothetical protein